MKEELIYLAAWIKFVPGASTLRRVKETFGSYREAWRAPAAQFEGVLRPEAIQRIVRGRMDCQPFEMADEMKEQGITLIPQWQDDYPPWLQVIPNPPAALFCRGDQSFLAHSGVAVVGARKATPYGKKTARMLGQALAECGITVISGLATGIDAEAHWGCLTAHGKTIGVLGNGVDIVYPRNNRDLYQRMTEEGLIVSEFYPGTAPDAKNFPIRNRIISGLSRAVIIVEAKEKSGAMITVDFALEQGRDVWTVPGPIFSELSQGTNLLLQQGARPLCAIEDVEAEFMFRIDQKRKCNNNMDDRQINGVLVNYLGYEPVTADFLLEKTGWTHGQLAAELLMLEMNGIIQSLPGGKVVRR